MYINIKINISKHLCFDLLSVKYVSLNTFGV